MEIDVQVFYRVRVHRFPRPGFSDVTDIQSLVGKMCLLKAW